ncbi:MAG: molybdopterin converting factor subunit 1 [Luminiphilus sp.]|jgi:molybdopterin synthase sulfur carrier subunit|nr:molybdopterin converting factor subunit 1 [Halieaceae bacterium]MCH1602605.1 molybdopterin converting factor subunit 1 [Luminiphilus sp.]PDH39481.1 MAG: molybdopterin converting factor subunit 1 [Halieaceae bacterium MED-G26]RPG92265.1 MAG: molybdopterin converting factor subunit 1 [Cellvibrionales bacterium TMED157]|tara:strand:- start:238 stop:492 length:255 start_codon:yes stop_codon:yes gene_type:complete
MTITVKFFSLIREAVDTEQLTLEMSDRLSTVEALKNELSLRGEIWKEALSHPNLIQAINQRVVFQEEGIKDGDEVAFFPPMTGG